LDQVEVDFAEVSDFVNNQGSVEALGRVAEIEGFVNEAVGVLNKIQDFKVHDLAITEKVKPLKTFLGHLF
jgi:hypothetical protein